VNIEKMGAGCIDTADQKIGSNVALILKRNDELIDFGLLFKPGKDIDEVDDGP
jgi:hypothetical protein